MVSHQAKVIDFVHCNRSWNWLAPGDLVPRDIIDHIAACFPPDDALGADSFLWKFITTGAFLVKLAYGGEENDENIVEDKRWKLI